MLRNDMKEYVVGAGGVGCFFGGQVFKNAEKSGAHITFVGRGKSYEAIKERGLVLSRPDGISRIFPPIIDKISEMVNPEVIILTVKSYNLGEVSQELARVVKPESTVITLQNGLDNDQEALKYLNCEVLPGLVLVAATKVSDNEVVQKGSQKKLIFGPRDGVLTPKMEEIERIFNESGIDVILSKHIAQELWKKFLFVVSFSSATVAGKCSIGQALSNPELRRVYENVLREAIMVGGKEGAIFEPNIFNTTLEGALNFDPSAKSSLLGDLENNRQTEVETLQGTVMRLAEKHSLAVPTINEVYRKIMNFNREPI